MTLIADGNEEIMFYHANIELTIEVNLSEF